MTIFNSYVKLAEGSKEIIKHNLINHPYVDGPFHTFIVRLWTNNVLLPIIALLVFMALISIYLHGSLCAVVHMCDFIPSKIESKCCRKKCLVPDPRRPFIHPTCASPWDDWDGGVPEQAEVAIAIFPVDSENIPSGKHTKNYGKSLFLMGKSTIHGHFQ